MMSSLDKNIFEELKKYNLHEDFYDMLEKFFDLKWVYMKNPTTENYLELIVAYDFVYSDLKQYSVCGKFSQDYFLECSKQIRQGLVISHNIHN